jgi:hypothetical protein
MQLTASTPTLLPSASTTLSQALVPYQPPPITPPLNITQTNPVFVATYEQAKKQVLILFKLGIFPRYM